MANEFSRKETVTDYQVYAGREGSQVDFNKEAEKITTGFQAIAKGREDKKAKIQSETDDVINQLNKADSFQSQTLGQTVLLAAKGLKETLLMQSKLVQKGKISPAEFMATLQTAKDDMANWGIAAKDWNEKYNNKEARQKLDPKTQKKIASPMETAIAEHTLAFGNLDNTVPWTSPTGNVYLVKMNKDGSMPDWETQRDQYGSMNNMNNLLLYQDDNAKYDISSLIKKQTDNLGNFITSTISAYTVEEGGGIVITKEGALQMNEYIQSEGGKKAFDQMVLDVEGVVLGDELSIANILVNRTAGKDRYIIAQTEQEFANQGGTDIKKWIRADYSTQPPSVFLETGQEDVAKGFVKREILTQLGQSTKKAKGMAGQQDSSATINSDKTDIKDAGYISELNDAFTNPNSAKSQAIIKRLIDSRNSKVENSEDRIRSIDIEPSRIIVRRGGDLDDLVIDRIGDSGKIDNPKTTDVDESLLNISTEDDIMSLIEILTPAGEEGISRGRVRDLIKSQKITLGDKLDRNISTSVSKTPLEPVVITSAIGDGSKTILSTIQDEVGEDVMWNTDNEIRILLDKVLTQATSKTLKEDLVKYKFPETTTAIVKGSIDGEGNFISKDSDPSFFEIQIAGVSTYIPLENAKGNKQTSENMSRQITKAINTAIEKANEARLKGAGGAKAGISFPEFRKIKGNETKTMAQWKEEFGIK